jgi:hypothetical protein
VKSLKANSKKKSLKGMQKKKSKSLMVLCMLFVLVPLFVGKQFACISSAGNQTGNRRNMRRRKGKRKWALYPQML